MNENPRVVILANGALDEPQYALSQLYNDDIVIAANGGSRLAHLLNRVPDILIGDSDSLPAEIRAWVQRHAVPIQLHPPEKDKTDLELAIEYALTLNPRGLLFLGIAGGRTDHMLANFSLLARIAIVDIPTEVLVAREHIYPVTRVLRITGKTGDIISLLPWGGNVEGVTTAGLKWELQDATLEFGSARGISNVMVVPEIEIRIQRGLLLAFHQRG